jgi:hypothetical protein
MLPNFETCRKHVLAYKRKEKIEKADSITFPRFWNYKTGLEKAGGNILDEQNLENTAARLQGLFSCLKIKNTGLTDIERMKQILRDIRPYYRDIRGVSLGSGEIAVYRSQIESIYERMGDGDDPENAESINVQSALLMAIWGQVPRLDNLNRIRFEKWTHWPGPEKLPHLKIKQVHYRPDEFCDMIEELDRWDRAWPETNYKKAFNNSFYDICPEIPPGRQIDIIYHWKLPETWVDYRLQTQGSGINSSQDNSIDEYYDAEIN